MNGPGVWVEADGSVVVQGVWTGMMLENGIVACVPVPEGMESQVRIPADVLRRAVLTSAIGYRVRVNGETLHVSPADVDVVFEGPG